MKISSVFFLVSLVFSSPVLAKEEKSRFIRIRTDIALWALGMANAEVGVRLTSWLAVSPVAAVSWNQPIYAVGGRLDIRISGETFGPGWYWVAPHVLYTSAQGNGTLRALSYSSLIGHQFQFGFLSLLLGVGLTYTEYLERTGYLGSQFTVQLAPTYEIGFGFAF